MKRLLISLCLIGSAVIFFDTINFSQLLILFVFAGILPGTNIVISPIDMMAASATAITVIILRITVWPLVRMVLVADTQFKHKAI